MWHPCHYLPFWWMSSESRRGSCTCRLGSWDCMSWLYLKLWMAQLALHHKTGWWNTIDFAWHREIDSARCWWCWWCLIDTYQMFCGREGSGRPPVNSQSTASQSYSVTESNLCCWFTLVFKCDIATETASFSHCDWFRNRLTQEKIAIGAVEEIYSALRTISRGRLFLHAPSVSWASPPHPVRDDIYILSVIC